MHDELLEDVHGEILLEINQNHFIEFEHKGLIFEDQVKNFDTECIETKNADRDFVCDL